jgi:histidinol-phosphate aminotransferase
MTKLVKDGHNVIVSRTFSKIYGLAGVRIGYLISSPERIAQLKKCTMAGTNMLATHAAMTAYDEKSFFDYSLGKNTEALEIFYDAFEELNLDYVKSYTNFAFFKTGTHIDEFSKYMKEKGILVGRPFPPYYDWCRISTGKIEDVRRFTQTLKTFYS